MSCSRRGPLRYVCWQTIDPTAMICTFLESPTNRDVCIPGSVLLFLAKIVETDVAEVGTQNNGSPVDDNYFVFFYTFWYVMHYVSFSCSDFEISGKIDVQKYKMTRLSFLVSRPWRGPLRHVCGHTNHNTTMVHAFLESLSNLEEHPGIRFSICEKKFRRNWK